MHDAFLIDFHANKQAKRTARMVFRPTPRAPRLPSSGDGLLQLFCYPIVWVHKFQTQKDQEAAFRARSRFGLI